MNIQSRIKIQTLVFSMFVLFVSWIIGYMTLTDEFEKSSNKHFEVVLDSAYNMLESEIKQEQKSLKYKLDKMLNSDDLTKAIIKKDKNKVDLLLDKSYSKMVSLDRFIENIIIYSKDGKPIYSKNENKTSIKNSNIKKEFCSGFKIDNSMITYRIAKPIFDKNKHIGFIEIAVSSQKIMRNLNLYLDIKTGIVINNKLPANKIELLNASDMLKYYFESSESEDFKFFKVNMQKRLLNYSNETVAYLVVGYDMFDIVNKNQEFIHHLFWIGVIVVILIIFIIYIGFNSLLKYTTIQESTDKLTGLNNRDSLNNDLSKGESNILILTNIKEFSLLNQYYGLEVANEVLKQVAIGFKDFAMLHNMKIYRTSADEYVLLSDDNRLGVVECGDILEELNSKISSMDIIVGKNNETLKVEIYSGVSFNGKLLLEEAQVALREAKIKALHYLAYTQNLDNKVDTKIILDIKKTIKQAVENKNVIPFFQPITNEYGEFIKYEALVRIIEYEDAEEKILYPDQFLPIAIRSGLYVGLAKEMLFRSLTFFKDRDEKISVNFLPNDFYNHEIMDRFIGLVQMYKKPERIVIEITEQEGVGDFDRLFKIVKKMRKLGVMIAIDDFGSGYANYIHILQLKPDYLKIDGSLIKNILTDKDSQILVKSITRFAGYMKIKTIAEYVENEEIFELLKTYGVDEFQGYYFGRPLNLISGPNIF